MDVLKEIAALDAEKDAERIALLSSSLDFPFDNNKALEFALFRTYCVPSIAALLDATGEFEHRTQKRYDDTVLLIAEFCENGLGSERGRQAIARMNAIHGRFKIANEDYLYVLSTFVCEPIRWNARFGWRPLVEKEKEAAFHLWLAIGRRMGIKDLPKTYAEMERFNVAFEKEHFRFNEASQRVGAATLGLFLSWMPKPLAPLAREAIYALLDEPVRAAFGFPKPKKALVTLVPVAMRALALVKAVLPKRKRPVLRHKLRYKTYPKGHGIDDLGPK